MSTIETAGTTTAHRYSDIAAQVQAEAEALRRRQRAELHPQECRWQTSSCCIFVVFAVFPIYFLVTGRLPLRARRFTAPICNLIPTNPTLDNFDHMINHTPLLTWLQQQLHRGAGDDRC